MNYIALSNNVKQSELEIAKTGGVEISEMYRTFNMGVGMILAVEAACADVIYSWLEERMTGVAKIGFVVDNGNKVTHAIQGVEFSHY